MLRGYGDGIGPFRSELQSRRRKKKWSSVSKVVPDQAVMKLP